jgi:hypothetical protein
MRDFIGFPKIPRLSRQCVITEKIDGTNGVIYVEALEGYPSDDLFCVYQTDGLAMWVGSRTRWITPEQDNFGFAKWALHYAEALMTGLGVGTHHGEWWGQGIQRGYGLKEKRFSLFNTAKWSDDAVRPSCCHVVPVLYQGLFDTNMVWAALTNLEARGSMAAPGFMNPEGVVVYHRAGNLMFKKTIKNDDVPKGSQETP